MFRSRRSTVQVVWCAANCRALPVNFVPTSSPHNLAIDIISWCRSLLVLEWLVSSSSIFGNAENAWLENVGQIIVRVNWSGMRDCRNVTELRNVGHFARCLWLLKKSGRLKPKLGYFHLLCICCTTCSSVCPLCRISIDVTYCIEQQPSAGVLVLQCISIVFRMCIFNVNIIPVKMT